jgi:hypothetical protein
MLSLVKCRVAGPRLFERADGRLWAIDEVEPAPFMAGYGYLVIERKLAEFLIAMGVERLRLSPASIEGCASSEPEKYCRVTNLQCFEPGMLSDINEDGLRILVMGEEHYFVTPDLKELIMQSSFNYLEFSSGLSEFAAGVS